MTTLPHHACRSCLRVWRRQTADTDNTSLTPEPPHDG